MEPIDNKKRRIRIALASPSDVAEEREAARKVIAELREQFQEHFDIEVVGWEDVPAGLHVEGAQGQIDAHIRFEECDYVVGIFWKRFGRPTQKGRTPTEHEIRMAFDAWKAKRTPQLLLYFSTQEYSPESQDDLEQRHKVLEFREEFRGYGLFPDYKTVEEFGDKLRSDLTTYLQDEVRTSPKTKPKKEGFVCTLNTYRRVIRGECITEPISDIELMVEGEAPGKESGPWLMFDTKVVLNANITNPIIGGRLADVVLELDDGVTLPARLTAINAAEFKAVPICRTGTVVKRRAWIRGLRANASQIALSSSHHPNEGIQAFVDLTGEIPLRVEGKVVSVGFNEPTADFWIEGPRPGDTAPCRFNSPEDRNEALAIDPVAGTAVLNFAAVFREMTPYAFRNRFQERSSSHGTRLVLWFIGVPNNTRVFVTTRDLGEQERARLVFDTDANGASTDNTQTVTRPVPTLAEVRGVPLAKLATNEFCVATWEWFSEEPRSTTEIEEIRFGVVLAVKQGQKVQGEIAVAGRLEPISTQTTAGKTAPVPRFLQVSNLFERAFVFD